MIEVIIECAIIFGKYMFVWLGTVYALAFICIMMDKLEKERKHGHR